MLELHGLKSLHILLKLETEGLEGQCASRLEQLTYLSTVRFNKGAL